MEAAEDLADPEDIDTPPGGQAADGGGQDDEESWDADASALHQANAAGR
jgi:hypothetical protein